MIFFNNFFFVIYFCLISRLRITGIYCWFFGWIWSISESVQKHSPAPYCFLLKMILLIFVNFRRFLKSSIFKSFLVNRWFSSIKNWISNFRRFSKNIQLFSSIITNFAQSSRLRNTRIYGWLFGWFWSISESVWKRFPWHISLVGFFLFLDFKLQRIPTHFDERNLFNSDLKNQHTITFSLYLMDDS